MRNMPLWLVLGTVVTLLFGCAGMSADNSIKVTLSGAQEVPPVTTTASGSGTITVGEDMSVSGSFKLQNAAQITVAHIHTGPAGKTGPVIIPLQKVADNDWMVPAGAKLTPAQYQSYKEGGLYVNFHSAKFKAGEIRGQIQPGSSGGRSGY